MAAKGLEIAGFCRAVDTRFVTKIGKESDHVVVLLRGVWAGDADTTGGVRVKRVVWKKAAAARAEELCRRAGRGNAKTVANSGGEFIPTETQTGDSKPQARAAPGALFEMPGLAGVRREKRVTQFSVVAFGCCFLCGWLSLLLGFSFLLFFLVVLFLLLFRGGRGKEIRKILGNGFVQRPVWCFSSPGPLGTKGRDRSLVCKSVDPRLSGEAEATEPSRKSDLNCNGVVWIDFSPLHNCRENPAIKPFCCALRCFGWVGAERVIQAGEGARAEKRESSRGWFWQRLKSLKEDGVFLHFLKKGLLDKRLFAKKGPQDL
jgi:hypothetical protein